MNRCAADVALLAPVPLVHVEDGAEVCARQGKVAFGSRAWQLFRELDALRHDRPVEVYIYASHSPETACDVTWRARYVRHVQSDGGAHPEGMRFRPPSTGLHPSDNTGHWAVFWEVEELERLPEPIAIGGLRGLGKPTAYARSFVPEGPVLIERP